MINAQDGMAMFEKNARLQWILIFITGFVFGVLPTIGCKTIKKERITMQTILESSQTDIEKQTFSDSDLENITIEGKVFRQCNFNNSHWQQVLFEKCRFEHCKFNNLKIDKVMISDSALYDCRWVNSTFGQTDFSWLSEFNKVEYAHCQFDQFRLLDSNAQQFSFTDCNIKRSTIGSKEDDLYQMTITHCELNTLQLFGKTLANALIEKCRFIGRLFINTQTIYDLKFDDCQTIFESAVTNAIIYELTIQNIDQFHFEIADTTLIRSGKIDNCKIDQLKLENNKLNNLTVRNSTLRYKLSIQKTDFNNLKINQFEYEAEAKIHIENDITYENSDQFVKP